MVEFTAIPYMFDYPHILLSVKLQLQLAHWTKKVENVTVFNNSNNTVGILQTKLHLHVYTTKRTNYFRHVLFNLYHK